MRRTRFLVDALRDLTELRVYLARASRSLTVSRDFTDGLRRRCQQLGDLPAMLGQARHDLGEGLRVLAHGDYVILFRYAGEQVEIVRILHGMRDLPHALNQDTES